jgi:Double-GTPase 2
MSVIRAVAIIIWAILATTVCAAFGVLFCTSQIFVEYVIAGLQVLFTQPAGLPVRAHDFTLPARAEQAKPNYFYGPARSDLRYIWQVTWSRWRDARDQWGEVLSGLSDPDDLSLAFTGPVAAGLVIGAIAALVLSALVMGVVWLVDEILLDFATVSVRCFVMTLRALDSAWLFFRRIQVHCVSCFERIPYPAYLCPRCKTIHWDIRPGPYGVLSRTCECGRRMPTTLLMGSAELEAICPRRGCRHPLEHRPGEVREVILPLFGPKGAGKTLLLWGIVRTLQQSVRPGISVDYADSDTEIRMYDLGAAVAAGHQVPATPSGRPKPYQIRLRIGRHRRLLQLPDPAGELFYDSQRSKDLLYLGAASTFILVIDPFSIDDFWDSLPSVRRDQLAAFRSVAPHPDQVYQQTAERIMQMGRRHAQRRLAVVFSRADLVGTQYGPREGQDEGIRKWAEDDLGLAGLLRDAAADFREVALFHTAPFGSSENDLYALVRWAMRAEWVARASPEHSSSLFFSN